MSSLANPRDVIIRPIVSEKSYAGLDANIYTFEVAAGANKIQIKQAVEEIFGVKVINVNTLNRAGKRKRNRRTGTWGQRSNQKRAIVSLAAGESIEIFGS
ncbi:MAG: 50S ribosomal protein L23 [Acidimicrobiia bacterium]|nr:50S ribosomal protein L23 [Acidimicrobiia bacterium]